MANPSSQAFGASRQLIQRLLTALFFFIVCSTVAGTPTENLGIRVLPASQVKVDGKTDDWDLSGGIFACDDVENSRGQFAVWVHAMYDQQNLYVLAHFVDPTPLNNPGQVAGDAGFEGDCLQFRIITHPATPQERGEHFTCWRGRDGKAAIVNEHGVKLNGGKLKDASTEGARQAFAVDGDGKGYVQEIAIPWKLLTADGKPLKAGERFTMTVEPNFTVGVNGRLSVKDIFKAGVQPDRVFAFMAPNTWGIATLEEKGNLQPKAVRLADGREFATRLEAGGLVVDWTGLEKKRARPAIVSIPLEMPTDGYASLIVKDASGMVVRELLTAQKLAKGMHQIEWDGLTTPNWRVPGVAVAAGDYTWSAIYHQGIGLRLKGWAANSGETPWDYPAGKGNWGGDHGVPSSAASDGQRVYLGWSMAEAGKALLGCDLEGNVQWHNTHGGIAGASNVAVDGPALFANNNGTLYRLNAQDGAYTTWEGSDATDLKISDLLPGFKESPNERFSMCAGRGKLYVASKLQNKVAVAQGSTGKLIKTLDVQAPMGLAFTGDGRLLVISEGKTLLGFGGEAEAPKQIVTGLQNAFAVTTDSQGRIYVGLRDPANQVLVFDADGKRVGSIGREGGRRLVGPWQADGMRFINSLAIDGQGKLWVMEADGAPKRVSVWDTKTNTLHNEFFGPSGYGALGGAIDPADPNIMVGQGCEWRIDPATGRATCLGTITRDGMEVSRFAIGPNGKTYLAVASTWAFNTAPLNIYERLGDAQYQLRTVIYYVDKDGKELPTGGHGQKLPVAKTVVWADENGDGERQENEIVSRGDGELRFSGWYMSLTPEMAIYAKDFQFKLAGFTGCGAPKYDLSKPTQMPAAGFGSADGRLVLHGGEYGVSHGWMTCYDIASGKALWRYPDTFVGVHGSHNAPPGEVGLIRGSFNPCGSIKLPEPIGNAWIIPTNVGEWHILTESGYYLTGLFEGDPLKVRWPEKAIPGAVLDTVPPGMGGEDFGGSVTLAKDGKLYLQAGKTAFWNIEVVGLESVKALGGGNIRISPEQSRQAVAIREQELQVATAGQSLVIHKGTANFTGDLGRDFPGAQFLQFGKQEDAAVRAVAAFDERFLYLGWDVKDSTPWVNGATEAEMMYLGGDTVDFQLGTDPAADKSRTEAGAGDLRLSIGNFHGAPAAVLYRKVARDKHPRTFSSGVVKEYTMQSVAVVSGALIKVKKQNNGYVVEAAIPLEALEFKPTAGMAYRGDFGVTHGDPAGQRTRLRTYWSNQHTGIVDDAVFELKMEPRNWGEIRFE
jgi:hypothetical protein